jgi:hypothetical protein
VAIDFRDLFAATHYGTSCYDDGNAEEHEKEIADGSYKSVPLGRSARYGRVTAPLKRPPFELQGTDIALSDCIRPMVAFEDPAKAVTTARQLPSPTKTEAAKWG